MSETKICPICGGDMVHPVAVYVRTEEPDYGPVLHTITRDGYAARHPYEDSSPCGVIIIREYLAECGHRWMEKEEFSHGSTSQEWQQLDPLIGPDLVIWRD